MPFDVQAARAAGYSDAEIADYLGKKSGFDVQGARKSGYGDNEIVDHIYATEKAKAREDSAMGQSAGSFFGTAASALKGASPILGSIAESAGKLWRARAGSGEAAQDAAKDEGFADRAGSLFERGSASVVSGLERTYQGLTGGKRSREAAQAFEKITDAPVQGQTTWQDVKDADGFLATAAKVPGFALDAGIESIPGMAVAALPYVGIGLYGASNTGNIARQRAQSDDRADVTLGDVIIAAPAGIASAYLERTGEFLAAKMPGKNILTSTVKAAGAEAATEAAQSSVEYLGGTVGTKKGVDMGEMTDQAISGALAGAGMGGALHLTVKGGAKVITLGEQYGPRALSVGARTLANINAGKLTPEDEASPIPNDLIQQGKVEVADAGGKAQADNILSQAGMPTTGKRVSITMPDGTKHAGTMLDAFDTDAGDLGRAHGMAVSLDNGTIFTEHFDTMREAGVKVAPLGELDAMTAEADALDAQTTAQGAIEPNFTGLNVHTRSPEDRGAVTGSGQGLNTAVLDGLRKRGLSEHVARGVAAGIQAESRSDPNVRGGYEGRALGIGQWLGERRAEIIRRYGEQPTLDQQLDFLVEELNGRDAGGKHVLAAQSDADALNAYITKFMRPAAGKETTSDLQRGAAALGVGVDAVSRSEAAATGPATEVSIEDMANADRGQSYLEKARSFGSVVGDPIDSEWSKFSDTSGTLNVPRDQMPQIKAEHRGPMVNFLNARGIAHEEQTVPASSLKPTQAEFSNLKVKQATEYTGGDRAILTSSDGYVLDGHHQWMAALAKGQDVRTIRLDAPISELLKTVPEFPSATDANGSTNTKPVEIPQDRSESPATSEPQKTAVQQGETGIGAAAPAATVEDFSDKSVIVRGLDDSQSSAKIIARGLPEKGIPLWNAKAGGWIISKKHAEKMRAVLADLQRNDAAAKRAVLRRPLTGKMPTNLEEAHQTLRDMVSAPQIDEYDSSRKHAMHYLSKLDEKGQEAASKLAASTLSTNQRLNAHEQRAFEIARDAAPGSEPSKIDKPDLRARPELGPTFGDPEGSLNRLALLRAANEGRGNSVTEGGRRWLIREGLVETDNRGKITGLTNKGKAELIAARDGSKISPHESDPDRSNSSKSYNPREGEPYQFNKVAGLSEDEAFQAVRDNDATKMLEWKGKPLGWYQLNLNNGDGAILFHESRNEARKFTGKGWAQYAHAWAIDQSDAEVERQRKMGATKPTESTAPDKPRDRSAAIIMDPAAGTVKTVPIGTQREEARQAGIKAWAEGKRRVTANEVDPAVRKEWYAGWDSANLAAPVENDQAFRDALLAGKNIAEASLAALPDDAGSPVEATSLDDFIGKLDAGYRVHFDYAGTAGRTMWLEKTNHGWTVKTRDDSNPRITSTRGGAGPSGGWTKSEALNSASQDAEYRFTKWKPLAEEAPTPVAVRTADTAASAYGQSNKLFTSDAAEKARALLKSKRNQLNAGFDPEIAQAGLTLMGYHIEAGARAFMDAARAVAGDLGMTPADLRNNLRSWYTSARMWLEDNGGDVRGMDDDATVKVDLSRIDQWGATTPSESAAPQAKETTNGDIAEQAGTQADGLRGDAERSASDVPAVEGNREAGSGSDRSSGTGNAGVQRDGVAGRGEGGTASDAGRADAGERPRQARSDRNRNQPGDRVPDGPKPERADRGVNFLAPANTLKREGGWRTTAERNLDIVELVNRLDAENRQATPEEQAQLVKFTGWGAGEIRNNLFRNVTRAPAGERTIVPHYAGDWKELSERASKLLTGDMLETALQSTQYAHYTSEQVIRSIWSGLRRLGFNGGKIVEPGMGTGLFAVAAPSDIFGRSNYTGIELDGFTAKIAQYLLPQETVLPGDYTKTKLPDGFFDIAIGNPPFANVKVTDDPAYKKHRFSLHDYFFAKTIDKVRPGGLLVFVTSRYTMDKLDQKARQYIADRADLLAAIRLPQTAFKENAGTEVVTDVLFLQRRAPGSEGAGKAWLTSEPLKIGADDVNVNSYYLAHPEMVLGKHATTGSMYRSNEYTVEPGEGSIEAAFAKAIENLPQNVYAEAAHASTVEVTARKIEHDMRPAAEKEGGVYLKDGEVYRRDNGVGTPVSQIEGLKLSAKDVAWLKDYVPLRDAIKQAQKDQLSDGDWESSLKALNKVYDAFVKKHGQVSAFTSSERTFTDEDGNENTVTYKRFTNRKRLETDIEGSLVEALEKIDDEGKISKSPFLLGRTLKKPTRPEINSAADAVAVALDEIGRFDLPYVAKLLGKNEDQVIADLGDEIYQHPDGSWLMADEYLSGDVVAKLDEANIAAKADPRFERNVEALVKVQPRPLGHADIAVKLGAGWIEPEVVEQFASEVLDENLTGIRYEQATGAWHIPDATRRWGRTSTSEWATDDRSARELLDAILNNRTIKVTRTDNVDGKKTTWTDQEATALANERAKKIGEKFKSWIWTDGPRSTRLVDKYNRLFNNLAPRKFDGKHLTFPGLSTRYKLFDHQRRAIWRVIATGNTYLNHAVGAGKTLEMIVSGMEQRRLGLIRKPMYVVPNHMLNQFAREFLDAYPAANIMVADENAFHTGNRRRFMAQAALNDPDAVIVTHSSFGKIQTSQETRAKVVDRFIAELEEIMDELKGGDNRIARSKVEKQIEQIKRRFEGKAAVEGKDKALTFEEMGVDFLYVDEAHEFRKLDFATNRTAVKGIDANGSQRSLDLYTKLLWLNEQRQGRAAVLASGTPVTNTMAEIFTVMRYMDQAGLERDGLAAFDAWAAMFGEVVAGFEQNPSGNYEMVERFSKFVNVPEMMKRVRTFMDVLTSDQLGDIVVRPALKGGLPENVIAEASDDLSAYMKGELAQRIEVSRKWKPSKDQPGNPDPIINIITDGRLSAIDMRFVDPMAGNDPDSKLNKMIDNIIAKHKEFAAVEYTDKDTGKPIPRKGATQIVFSAVGFGEMVAKSRGFDARAWIDKRLADAGISKDAVAWMSDQNSNAKKEATFKAMRNAEKRVLIGSPKNMGTGVNVQGRLKVLHFLSPPWYPSDVEQPHGRIIRQGNMNTEAEIYWYATKGTYDSTAWNMVSRKQRFIEQAMRGDDTIRSLEDISEANQYEMASALAAGDERVIQLAGLSNDIERLTKLKAAHTEEQVNLKWRMEALDRLIEQKGGASARLAAAIEARGKGYQPFSITVDGVRYDKPGEAGQAMLDAAQRAMEQYDLGDKDAEVELGRYQGTIPVIVQIGTMNVDGKPSKVLDVIARAGPVDLDILENRTNLERTDPTGFSQRIGNALNRLEADKGRAEQDVVDAKRDLAQAQRKIGAPFEYEGELGEKVAERERLQSDMAAETAAAQKAADAAPAPTVQDDRAAFLAEANDEAYAAPDGIEATRDAGTSDPLRGDQGAVSVLGLGVAAEIERTGSAALVGQSVGSAKELGSLAQVYRDPRYETFRVFFTKGNEIVHATGVSSRLPNETPLLPGGNDNISEFEGWLVESMKAAGADGYYLLHNHPSGDPQPSKADIEVTSRVSSAVPGYRGHVVINSNRFAVITEYGSVDMHNLWLGEDKLISASKPHPIIGEAIGSSSALAKTAKQVQRGEYLTIIGVDSKKKVRVLVEFPSAHLEKSELRLAAAARRLSRISGSTDMFVVGSQQDVHHPSVVKAYKRGIILEGVDDTGRTLMNEYHRDPSVMKRSPWAGVTKANFVADDREPFQPGPVSFDDTETERRFQDAKAGLDSPQSFRARAGEWMETAWHGMTRHWASLPNVPKYADLQQKLRAIESAPQHARERTIAMLEEMVKDFSKEDLDLFTRKVILDDLSWDAANDRDLPFGFTPETLLVEKQKVDAAVQADPDKKVWRAAMKRKLANRKVAQELVDAGVLEAEQIKNPAYYRHQVLEYARAQAQYARTPGKKLRQPKWAKRMGSSLDINANLLEAEFDWLNKAFIDIPVAKTIEWIKKSEHNILDDLRSEAKAGNKAGIDAAIVAAKEVLGDKRATQDEQMKAALLIDQERGFRQHIAMGFDHVRTALENGDIDVPRQFQKAADAIQFKTSDTSDPPFAFLAWMLDNDQPGAMGAAMIMKAIGRRRTWTKALLGKAYVDPQNADELVKRLAPEGYRTWQPDEGKLLFTVKTIPEHVIDAMITKLDAPEGVDPIAFRAALEGARSQLAMGGDRYTMILPEEVADTLSNLRREELDGMFEMLIRNPVRWWKRWVLINPRRVFKYNLNNLSGDFDAVLAGNPHLLRRVKEAGRELADVKLGKAKASARYNEAVARGVFDSGLSIQEIPDINQLAAFERFANEPGKINKLTAVPLRKAWNALQGATQWRENIFRYAAYLDYADRIEQGESQASIGYGGSIPKMVDAVTDPKDRAALLARDLLGDYGAISHWGSWLRGTILPFWSWSEINTKRYWRLSMNAYSQGVGKGLATGGGMALAAGARRSAWLFIRMAMLYGMLTLWNSLFFPDEEDELGEQQRQQMHVILGRNANGEIITLRLQGALGDAVSWLGLGDMAKAARDYELGLGDLSDVLTAMPKAVVNKIGGNISPIIKAPVEAATGKILWPDVFSVRENRDAWRNTLASVSLDNEYDALTGKPSRGYGRSWEEAFIYRKDPGEMAYNESRGIVYDWLKRTKGQEFEGGFSTPRGNAMRDYRTSLQYGDQTAADKALAEMVRLGVDQGDYNAMMKRAAPLGPLAKKDRAAFVQQLTPDEYATMVRAQGWYEKTLLGR